PQADFDSLSVQAVERQLHSLVEVEYHLIVLSTRGRSQGPKVKRHQKRNSITLLVHCAGSLRNKFAPIEFKTFDQILQFLSRRIITKVTCKEIRQGSCYCRVAWIVFHHHPEGLLVRNRR